MTQDEIIRMAREAGAFVFQSNFCNSSYDFNLEQLERFAALVAEATKAQLQDHSEHHLNMVQDEPVAYVFWGEGNAPELRWDTPKSDDVANALYYTPPSVEAAIEATKEKAAKVCELVDTDAFGKERPTPEDCAAAIRGMK